MVYGCQLTSGIKLIAEIIFDKASNSVNVQMTAPKSVDSMMLMYFNHALAMIANK